MCIRARTRQQQRRKDKNKPKVDPDDYYAVLDVNKTASPQAIKSAYRKLALKYHPDKVKEEEKEKAADTFHTINQAYKVCPLYTSPSPRDRTRTHMPVSAC